MAVIRTERLTKRYGSHRGIDEVDLAVDAGEVFGFLGPNGAGKTTLIRLLLDLIRPTSGRAEVLGMDSVRDAVAIHRLTGYLPGDLALYDRLTGGETLEYFGNLRGGIDRGYQAHLVERFDLDPSRRYREYSRGNRQKVGLLIALQHRPELLILDEPTSGLDPLVQRTFFEVLRERVADGATAFLSSHVLGEVERSCDRVGIIREGRLVTVGRVDALRDLAHHDVELRFGGAAQTAWLADVPDLTDLVAEGETIRLRLTGPLGPLVTAAVRHDLQDIVVREPGLEQTFLARFGPPAGEEAAGTGSGDAR